MIIRRFDQLGRVVIPMEWRKELGFETGSLVDISKEGNRIVLQKYEENCVVCGEKAALTIKDKKFCRECFNYIKNF